MGVKAEQRFQAHSRRQFDRETEARRYESHPWPGLDALRARLHEERRADMDRLPLSWPCYEAVREMTLAMTRGEVIQYREVSAGAGTLIDWREVRSGATILTDAPAAEVAIEMIRIAGLRPQDWQLA